MATRFYFSRDLSGHSVTPDAAWFEPLNSDTFDLNYTRGSSAMSDQSYADIENNTTGVNRHIRSWLTEPLPAQTISGTVKAVMKTMESLGALNSQIVIKVVSFDTSTVRGTLLAADASTSVSNEWSAEPTLEVRRFPVNYSGSGASLSSVTAQTNDRILVEVGYRLFAATSTNRRGTVRAGEADSGDLPETEGSTTNAAPWIEFSQDLFPQEEGWGTLI